MNEIDNKNDGGYWRTETIIENVTRLNIWLKN